MNLFEQFFNEIITPYLEPRIKKSSLKAVKGYVKGVETARKIAIVSYQASTVAAVLVTGVLLIVIAALGLLPIEPRTAFVALLVLGALLVAIASILIFRGLSEKTWLEMSKSREMMEAALKPWETPYSIPDPREILQPSQVAQRTPVTAPSAHDFADRHAPPATYPTLTTPDAAIATRSVDTTISLQPE